MTAFLSSLITPERAIYLVNLALAVLVISGSGLLAAALFCKQSAPLRHGILVSSLIFTLLAPGLIWCAGHNGWGLIALSFAESPAKPSLPATAYHAADDFSLKPGAAKPGGEAKIPAFPFALHPLPQSSRVDTQEIRPAPVATKSAALPVEMPASPAKLIPWRVFTIAIAALVWLIGTVGDAVWVIRGFFVLRRFRRSLEIPSLDRLDRASREAAAVLGVDRLPPIRVSIGAPAPLSLGLLNPLIVLPKNLAEEIDAKQLRAILIHEAAHLVHHHHWIGLAQWLAGILYWWNPLLHWVNRGILQLREEICDDHVLESQADGYEFAQVLVDLAARMADLPRVPATLAILETGFTDLHHRISNLLDKERKIMTRMTRKATVLVLLVGLMIALLIPFAGVRAEQTTEPTTEGGKTEKVVASEKSEADAMAMENPAKLKTKETNPPANKKTLATARNQPESTFGLPSVPPEDLTYQCSVNDMVTGKPLEGADVKITLCPHERHKEILEKIECQFTKTDKEGKYSLRVPASLIPTDQEHTLTLRIDLEKAGYLKRMLWLPFNCHNPSQKPSFRFAKLCPYKKITVRVLDPEGDPLDGVHYDTWLAAGYGDVPSGGDR